YSKVLAGRNIGRPVIPQNGVLCQRPLFTLPFGYNTVSSPSVPGAWGWRCPFPSLTEKRMSTSTETEREPQSFAEAALRLSGKTEEEARRTGAVDQADEQVEALFVPR